MEQKRGFTLIELSMVIVIIGLLVGGVLVGNDLVKAAEMRQIASDFDRFMAASNTFRLKYNCIAGDCKNATSFFPTSANGDGDKQFDPPSPSNETWLFWQHLALAGLIEGEYTGDNGPDGPYSYTDAIIGVNVPGTSRKGVGFSIGQSLGDYGQPAGGKYPMVVGGDNSAVNANIQTYGAVIPILEVKQFDDKYDDGVANSGWIRASHYWFGGCTFTGTYTDSYDYNISAGGSCAMMMLFRP